MSLLAISILPVVVLGTYIYNKDKNKESKKLLAKLFLSGLLSIILTLIISGVLDSLFPILAADSDNLNLYELFFNVFFGVALVEEFSKWIMVYKISYNHKEFDEVYDAIVYTTFVALGFACFENILYVLEEGMYTGIIRAFTAVPGHTCDGVLMGYYLGLAKLYHLQNDNAKSKKNLALSLIVPTIAHGIYDYCAMSGNGLLIIGFIVFIIFMFSHCKKTVKKIAQEERRLNNQNTVIQNNHQPINQTIEQQNETPKTNNFCPNCGTKVESVYCPNCGTKNM